MYVLCMHVGCISCSAGWAAPEQMSDIINVDAEEPQSEPYTQLTDVYSVGLMLQWLMMIGMPQLPIDASLKAALKDRRLFAHSLVVTRGEGLLPQNQQLCFHGKHNC